MFPSCMTMHEWNVHVLNPFFIYSFLLSSLPHFLFACTSRVNFSNLLCFFYLLSRKNISAPMLSRHIIFLSLETNIIWFFHCRKYGIPPFYYFIIFLRWTFNLDFRVVNKFRIHNDQSLMQCIYSIMQTKRIAWCIWKWQFCKGGKWFIKDGDFYLFGVRQGVQKGKTA